MSIRNSGAARRSFIIGSRLCPPAITRASGPRRWSSAIASSTLVARSYSNGAGTCTGSPPPPPHPWDPGGTLLDRRGRVKDRLGYGLTRDVHAASVLLDGRPAGLRQGRGAGARRVRTSRLGVGRGAAP